MALVRAVTFLFTSSGSMLPVAGSMSAQTIFAPRSMMGSLVAVHVMGVVITSSPGPTPARRRAR